MEMLKEVMNKSKPEEDSPTNVDSDVEENETQAIEETSSTDEETESDEPSTASEAVDQPEVEPEALIEANQIEEIESAKTAGLSSIVEELTSDASEQEEADSDNTP